MRKSNSAAAPLDRIEWKVVAVAIIGSMLAQLDATVVNVALSTLARDLHATVSSIQWVVGGYLLALALMLPLSGFLVDRIGAKRLYLICFVAFTAASMLCGQAWSIQTLIAFRVIQGMAGGLLAPMAQMTIARVAGRQMARVMGYSAIPMLLGPLLGPVLAGAILQHASWRWLFYINLPMGAAGIALALLYFPSDLIEKKPRPFDLPGFLLLSPGLVCLLYGADRLGQPYGVVVLVIALLLIATFILRARKMEEAALVDLRLFRNRMFSSSAVTQFMANGLSFAGQMLIPLYLMLGCHMAPAKAGLLLSPVGIGMICTVPFIGSLTDRFGYRPVASAGAALATISAVILAMTADGRLNVWIVITALLIRGAGLGSINIPSMSSAYAAMPREKLPSASTAINIVQRLGGPILTISTSIFLSWRLREAAHGAQNLGAFAEAFWFLAALHVLCLIATTGLPVFLKPAAETHAPVSVRTAEALAD